MPAPLSIIIPTLDAATSIGPTIGALGEGLSEGIIAELIITDGGSTDEIAEIADQIGANLVCGTPGRGQQLARAAKTAKASWFLFLHADTVLPNGWTNAVRDHIQTYPNKAAYFDLRFDDLSLPARLTASWANLRSRLFHLPYGDQGLLVPRKLYTSCGGYPEIAQMEDIAIARALKSRIRPLGMPVITSSEKYRRNGWLRQGTHNLRAAIQYLMTS